MFSRPKILFLVSLLFVALLNPKFNPYLLFKFLIFYYFSQTSPTAFQFLCTALAIDTIDGRGLSYEARRVLLPKKSKLMLYLPFITQ